jgi:hypothetical protein
MCALSAELARAAGIGVELDDMPGFKVFSLTGRACDCVATHVELEVRLLEEVGLLAAHEPRLADDLNGCGPRIRHERAVDVSAVDVELTEP